MHWLLLLALIIIIGIVVCDCSKKENFTTQESGHLTLAEEESLKKIADYTGYVLICISICCLLSCSCSMYFIFVGASSGGKSVAK